MQRLVELARTSTVDAFLAAAELAEISDDAAFFAAAPANAKAAPSSSSGSKEGDSTAYPVPPPSFYLLLTLAYIQTGDFAMAESTLLRWYGQLVDSGSMPPTSQPPAPVKEPAAAVACLGLLTVCRQSLRHFYDVAFQKLLPLLPSPSAPHERGTIADAAVSVGSGGEAAQAVVVAYAEACLDSLAARFVRMRESLYAPVTAATPPLSSPHPASAAAAGEHARLEEAAEMLNITTEQLRTRLAADESRKAARAAARETLSAKAVESGSLVEAAIRVGTFA